MAWHEKAPHTDGVSADKANPVQTRYFVSKTSGLCYSLASGNGKMHSHDDVPCTDKVLESVPPEQRRYARETVPTRPVAAQTAPFPFQLNLPR